MIRTIIHIDEGKCNGCGLCAQACQEGAIAIVDGKAKLLRDDYCDGLGNCLPVCPTDAISFIQREAAAFDEAAVAENLRRAVQPAENLACGCPGSQARAIPRPAVEAPACPGAAMPSQLRQWPVQIKLVPPTAPYLQGADLLVAADCTAYAYAGFHQDFIRGRVTLVGCPKLDQGDYSEAFIALLRANDVRSITVARMEVPCCGGIERAVRTALERCGRDIPLRVCVISTDGTLLTERG